MHLNCIWQFDRSGKTRLIQEGEYFPALNLCITTVIFAVRIPKNLSSCYKEPPSNVKFWNFSSFSKLSRIVDTYWKFFCYKLALFSSCSDKTIRNNDYDFSYLQLLLQKPPIFIFYRFCLNFFFHIFVFCNSI